MSRHIIYVDESGDHGLASIDPEYPVFVLAFCVFEQRTYVEEITPRVQQFKFDYFGHDMTVLHEREIRKQLPPFEVLRTDRGLRERFLSELSAIMEEADCKVIAAVIDKRRLQEQYHYPENPYNLAMAFALERAAMHLKRLTREETWVVLEARGKAEDRDAELEFRRVGDGANQLAEKLPFQPLFVSKEANSTGLQLADLIARPIGRFVLDRTQPNRAYDIIRTKLRRSPKGDAEGWGIKVFP